MFVQSAHLRVPLFLFVIVLAVLFRHLHQTQMLDEYAQSPKITMDELLINKLLRNVSLVVSDCDNRIAAYSADSAVFSKNVRQLNERLAKESKQTKRVLTQEAFAALAESTSNYSIWVEQNVSIVASEMSQLLFDVRQLEAFVISVGTIDDYIEMARSANPIQAFFLRMPAPIPETALDTAIQAVQTSRTRCMEAMAKATDALSDPRQTVYTSLSHAKRLPNVAITKQSILWAGDSLLRNVYSALCRRHLWDEECEGSMVTNKLASDRSVAFHWAPSVYYQQPTALLNTGHYDKLVVSMGAWDLGKYFKSVDNWCDTLDRRMREWTVAAERSNTSVYWFRLHATYGETCAPDNKDCREANDPQRVSDFRACANASALAHNVAVIDTLELTEGLDPAVGYGPGEAVHTRGTLFEKEVDHFEKVFGWSDTDTATSKSGEITAQSIH
ncbi:hypothetical protein SARC_07464 [Sphaeroforma arctica JP610]|uniref:Uncharacterized protein n=1 Tax=Sphaeroforma arctica JP610 TaxID=667725 RepID=A0A0L0FUF3_9EUKA|nr:hypothetical protein SARC_07464 [Sphaeroforma arctica JP610]KNC80171.1 hypothetical protein SARC_07464 [Sphaeroforma arctica JP610]|eukprot:XP_014154073.1 hypothetical protein SARC_07464 [Sphaeroforma arctica JP610]